MTIDEARAAMHGAIRDIREMDASRATCCPTWSPTAIRDAAAAWRDAVEVWYAEAVEAGAPDDEWTAVLAWDDEVGRHVRQADLVELDASIYGVREF